MVFTHEELVDRAKKWLRGQRYRVVVSEVLTSVLEIPDAIGFSTGKPSTLVECKASRSDFLADAKKYFRRRSEVGLGHYRYYLCPQEMIKIDEVPSGWGLLYACPRIVKVMKPAQEYYKEASSQDNVFLISLLSRVNYVYPGGIEKIVCDYSNSLKQRSRSRERS